VYLCRAKISKYEIQGITGTEVLDVGTSIEEVDVRPEVDRIGG
jgi:hypothetical protein